MDDEADIGFFQAAKVVWPIRLDVFGREPENSNELISDEFANSQVTGNTGSSLLERNLCSQLQTAVSPRSDVVEIRTVAELLFSMH